MIDGRPAAARNAEAEVESCSGVTNLLTMLAAAAELSAEISVVMSTEAGLMVTVTRLRRKGRRAAPYHAIQRLCA